MVGLRIQIKHINTSHILDPTNPSKLPTEGVLCEFLMSFKHDFQISSSMPANGQSWNISIKIIGEKILQENNANKLFAF
jgi:hypothetical protein